MFIESTYSISSSDTLYTQKKLRLQMEKDLEAAARTLRANNACEDLCWGMAQEFKKINRKFDVNKFMKASSITFNSSN